MGHPVAGAIDDGADLRISRVQKRSGVYNGATFLFNRVAVLDGMVDDLMSTPVHVKNKTAHAEDCTDNPRNRPLTDCGRKHCAGDRDYRGLFWLNESRPHILRHLSAFVSNALRSRRMKESIGASYTLPIGGKSIASGPAPRSGMMASNPNIGVGREEVGAFLVPFRARLRLKRNARTLQCVSKVEFPEHGGHRQGGSLQGVWVDEGRAVVP